MVWVVPESPPAGLGLGLLGFGCVGDGLVGAFWVLAPRGRACARRKAQGGRIFALCAMGFFGVCLQCSLRLAPAAAVALAVFGAVRCSVGLGFEVLCLVLGALRTGLVGVCWMRSGCWLRGTEPALAGRRRGDGVFALCARGFGDRLQGSLRTDPAVARGVRGGWINARKGVSCEKGFQVVAPLFIRWARSLGFPPSRCAPELTSPRERRTLRIKLLPGAVPVLSYRFNC